METKEPDRIYISNIQRFSVHDGPGIRTLVFFLGCPLRCKWCQNPENLKAQPQLTYNRQDCIGCGECLKVCPQDAISVDQKGRIQTDRNRCEACGRCVEVCFPGARSICGTSYTVEGCFKEILKDRVFYRNSGGGVTLSGGEPTMYPDFVSRLLELCQEEGIYTAIETCGHTNWKSLERVARFTDLFLYDIKAIDPEKHRRWTGVDNRRILSNARRLARMKKKMIVRVPLIPGVNDNEQEFRRIVEFAKSLETVKTMHLLPFHHIGKSKYETLDMDYAVNKLKEPDEKKIEKCRQIGEQYGLRVDIGGSGFVSEGPEPRAKQKEAFFIYPG